LNITETVKLPNIAAITGLQFGDDERPMIS